MRTCKKCGNVLTDDALVCPYCAKKTAKVAVNGTVVDGIALEDGDQVDTEYKKSRESTLTDRLSTISFSSSWLRSISGRYEFLTWLIYLSSIPVIIAYFTIFDAGFTPESIMVCVVIVELFVFAGMGFSAIGAHLKGMADIVDLLNEIKNKK